VGYALAVIASIAPSPAAAQVYGVLQAVAGPGVPPITSVAVQAQEFDDVNSAIADTIQQALAARGIQVDAGAMMILAYDTELSAATSDATDPQGVDLTELGASGENQDLFPQQDIGPLYGEWNVPSLPIADIPLGGGKSGRDLQGYSLSFFLGADGSPPVWQGVVRSRLPQQDPVPVARSMIGPLVRSVGQSVPPTRVMLQR
jgi:hypothetical protein